LNDFRRGDDVALVPQPSLMEDDEDSDPDSRRAADAD
jgi:hypothetical protein